MAVEPPSRHAVVPRAARGAVRVARLQSLSFTPEIVLHQVVTKKVDKPLPARRAGVSARLAAPTARASRAPYRVPHALAPEHLGEIGSVALLAVAILAVALFIVGISMLVGGLTIGSKYASNGGPPPGVQGLGTVPLAVGGGLTLLSMLLVAAAGAVLAEVRRSRVLLAALTALSAALSAAGVAMVMRSAGGAPILAAGLAAAALVFGVCTVIFARQR